MDTTVQPQHQKRNPSLLLSGIAHTQVLITVLFLFFAANSLLLWGIQVFRFPLVTDAGYGDSYVLYDIWHFDRTGVIYRDLSQPPYLPAQYSPLVYLLYSIPARIAWTNPFSAPRLAALGAFVLCIAVVVSIVRVLVPVRRAWLWGLLLASSIRSMDLWPLQLRGDFAAIFFGLTSIRLMLVRSSRAVLLAGLCAGLATQFKITYVAALAAGSLWLLFCKRWKDLAIFLGAAASTSAGLYFIFGVLQPRMFHQMLSLAPGIRHVRGSVRLALDALKEPIVLLALPALPMVVSRRWSRWMLLLLFICLSFVIGALTDIQAGGNINYFFEVLFALTPVAVLGIYQLVAWSRSYAGIALFTTALVLIHFLLPVARDMYDRWNTINPSSIRSQNAAFNKFAAALRDRHLLSTIPRIALLDPEPALVEPFLLSYMQKLGKFDGQPIMARIRNDEFDVVVTSVDRFANWRGIPHVNKELEASIASAYKPECATREGVVYLPRTRPQDDSLVKDLASAGCIPRN